MNAIEKCYAAYSGARDTDTAKLDAALALADECMVRKEFLILEAAVREYCGDVEQQAFAAGFRFATRLWVEGLRE